MNNISATVKVLFFVILKEIASVRANKVISVDFFLLSNSIKYILLYLANAGIFYHCQNEHFNIHVPLPIKYLYGSSV
jgi:hypothetical protein